MFQLTAVDLENGGILWNILGLKTDKMDIVRTFGCCDRRKTGVWKATGIFIGWLSLITSTWIIYEVLLTPTSQSTIVSIIYIILILYLNVKDRICKYVTIFLCGESSFMKTKVEILEIKKMSLFLMVSKYDWLFML